MLKLPAELSSAILPLASLFSKRVWTHAIVLLAGAILAPAQRTVASALRVMGLSQQANYQRYHRVLNRAVWSALESARGLLRQLIEEFIDTASSSDRTIILALDETIERRRGPKIETKGIYRDAVRSSRSHMAKTSGLRWISMMLLVPVPFARRRWALPILTVLAPSERYNKENRRRHKKLTDWARQALLLVKRWLPDRRIVCLGDSNYAAIDLLASVAEHVCMITRLRLDAALYEPPPLRTTATLGRPRLKGKRLMNLDRVAADGRRRWQKVCLPYWYGSTQRQVELLSGTAIWYHCGKPPLPIRWVLVRDPLGKFETQAFLSTDTQMSAEQVLGYYVERWQVEVTFREVREHLGVETQRQWNPLAIARTTPVLMSLYSIVTLTAARMHQRQPIDRREAAWYRKEQICFSDAIAALRRSLWSCFLEREHDRASIILSMSPIDADIALIPRPVINQWLSTLCYGT